MNALANQIALVTGASSGIGRAIALALAGQGASLCLVGRKPETLEEVAGRARAMAPRVLTYQTDLTRDDAIRELVGNLKRDVGFVDIVIQSAGVHALGKFEAATVDSLDWQYRTNVRAIYALTQALLPMLRPRRGQIVFVNSSAALHARAGVGAYAATKHALRAIADSLREEVNPDGIRVLSVFLGRTATPLQAALHKLEGKTYDPARLVQPEDVASVVLNALTLPRTAEVTEISIRPLVKPT